MNSEFLRRFKKVLQKHLQKLSFLFPSVMYQREHTSSSIFLIVPPSIAVMPAPLTALSNVSNKNTEIKMEDSSIDCELLIDRSFRSILLKIYTKKMKTYSKNDF